MNLKAIIAVMVYYFIIASVYHFGFGYLNGSSTTGSIGPNISYSVNNTNPSYSEGSSNFFAQQSAAINNIGGTLGFMFFGIGLPADTPDWLQFMFNLIFTGITTICVIIVINSIWGGGGG